MLNFVSCSFLAVCSAIFMSCIISSCIFRGLLAATSRVSRCHVLYASFTGKSEA